MLRGGGMAGRDGTSGGSWKGPPPQARSLRERFGALRNLPPFLRLIWRTSPWMTAGTLGIRLLRALLPIATLYVGKLIIDEVIRLAQAPAPPTGIGEWLASGLVDRLL